MKNKVRWVCILCYVPVQTDKTAKSTIELKNEIAQFVGD